MFMCSVGSTNGSERVTEVVGQVPGVAPPSVAPRGVIVGWQVCSMFSLAFIALWFRFGLQCIWGLFRFVFGVRSLLLERYVLSGGVLSLVVMCVSLPCWNGAV